MSDFEAELSRVLKDIGFLETVGTPLESKRQYDELVDELALDYLGELERTAGTSWYSDSIKDGMVKCLHVVCRRWWYTHEPSRDDVLAILEFTDCGDADDYRPEHFDPEWFEGGTVDHDELGGIVPYGCLSNDVACRFVEEYGDELERRAMKDMERRKGHNA